MPSRRPSARNRGNGTDRFEMNDSRWLTPIADRYVHRLFAGTAAAGSQAPPRSRYCLNVQAGELTLPVLLDTGRSPDLATCGDGNRARIYHNKIRDAQAMRVGYRPSDFTFDR